MNADRKHLWRSFAGGEIAEELYGRYDLPRYNTGLALCENFVVTPQGPVKNRAGTRYTRASARPGTRSRVIPFIRGNGQSLVVELAHEVIRFHKNGGTILEPTALQPVTAVVPATAGFLQTTFTAAAHGFVDGDLVVLSGFTTDTGASQSAVDSLMNVQLRVVNAGANTFQLERLIGALYPVRMTSKFDAGETLLPGMVQPASANVLELASPYQESELFDVDYAQDVDTMTLTHVSHQQRELRRAADNAWSLTPVALAPTVVGPSTTSAAVDGPGAGGGARGYYYFVTAVVDGEESATPNSATVANTLWVAGHRNRITCSAVPGASHYNIYKTSEAGGGASPRALGFIGSMTQPATGFLDQNIEPDFSVNPPATLTGLDAAGAWPAAVGYYEQRRVFAGSEDQPQSFWLTNTGQPGIMTYKGAPPLDSDGFTYKLSSLRANAIRFVVALKDMLLLTGANVWRVYSTTGDLLSATAIGATPDLQQGSAHVKPAVASNAVLYAAAQGHHLVSIDYSQDDGGYVNRDLSVLAPHYIDGYRWRQMDFQNAPVPTWWGVRDDGRLIGMTYMPAEGVIAWHQHVLGGEGASVESVAVVPEGNRDVVYVVVRRVINGSEVRYIEYITDRHEPPGYTEASGVFLDCSLTYEGAPTTTLSGLEHLTGETVTAVADGVVLDGLLVESGSVTLPQAAAVIHVGLRYTPRLKTLPLPYQAAAYGVGEVANVNSIKFRVRHLGAGLSAGPDFDTLRLALDPLESLLGAAVPLYSGIVEIPLDPEWSNDGCVCVEMTQPAPITISAMVPEFATGD